MLEIIQIRVCNVDVASQKAASSMEKRRGRECKRRARVYLLGKIIIPLSGHCGAASTVVKVALTIR